MTERDGPQSRLVHHDWQSEESLALTVVDAVAAVRETEPFDLPPLAEAVDADALNRLFSPCESAPDEEPSAHVTFGYHECTVRVWSSGDVAVHHGHRPDAELTPSPRGRLQDTLSRGDGGGDEVDAADGRAHSDDGHTWTVLVQQVGTEDGQTDTCFACRAPARMRFSLLDESQDARIERAPVCESCVDGFQQTSWIEVRTAPSHNG